jgi:hypothetical protein
MIPSDDIKRAAEAHAKAVHAARAEHARVFESAEGFLTPLTGAEITSATQAISEAMARIAHANELGVDVRAPNPMKGMRESLDPMRGIRGSIDPMKGIREWVDRTTTLTRSSKSSSTTPVRGSPDESDE